MFYGVLNVKVQNRNILGVCYIFKYFLDVGMICLILFFFFWGGGAVDAGAEPMLHNIANKIGNIPWAYYLYYVLSSIHQSPPFLISLLAISEAPL